MVEVSETHPQTIEQVNAYLGRWAEDIVGEVNISSLPPGAPDLTAGVSLYLFDIVRNPPLRGPKRPRLELFLRYLVTTWGPDQLSDHHLLNKLIFAAMIHHRFDVEDTSIPTSLWRTFGLIPRPSFILRYPLQVTQYELAVPLVRESKIGFHRSRVAVYGRLLVANGDPAGLTWPLVGARVEVPGGQQVATTDGNGDFHLVNVPRDPSDMVRLRIVAKGRTFHETIRETGGPGAPVRIELSLPLTLLRGHLRDQAGRALAGVRVELPSQRQFFTTRSDGLFIFDGLPNDLDLVQVKASCAGEVLDVDIDAGAVTLTYNDVTPPTGPVVIEF